MNKEQLATMLLNILEKQSFEDWHGGDFQDYITGEENAPTKADVLKELEWQWARELCRAQAFHQLDCMKAVASPSQSY